MRDAVILLLCAVALAQGFNQNPDERSRPCNCNPSEAQQICQANYDNDNVLIAHENCDKFYKCANGKPVAYNCPSHLLYDPLIEKCEWPENVDCGDRPISEGTDNNDESDSDDNDSSDIDNDVTCNCNPGEAPSICAAEGSNGILVAHQNCNQFYKCAEGRPVTFDCPPTLLYNPYKEECDWPQNIECGDRVIPEPDSDQDNDSDNDDNNGNDGTCNCNPEEAPAICAAPDSEGVLIAHESCNKYYICNHGKPVAVSCYGDLLFNPYTKQCDWPRNVDCGDRLVPETECAGCNDDTSNDTSCDDDDDVAPPDADDIVPPPSNDSDPEDSDSGSSDIDDRPPSDDVPPKPPIDDGTCNCNPEEAPSICASEDSSGVLVAHKNCNQYYKCDHGKPVVLTCFGNLLYNPYTEQCDWPENVDCGDRVIPDPENEDSISNESGGNESNGNEGGGNCDPSEAPTICAADDSEGVLIAHENCNQFYVCNGGKPVALKCPPKLLFNPNTDQCDWAENVDCGDRVIPDPENEDSISNESGGNESDSNEPNGNEGGGNCDPSEAPTICAADDSEGVLVAHENCNQFYVCNGGKPIALKCPPKLLFNPNTDQCDWAENVDCGDRVIPDPENEDSISNESGGNESDSNEPNGNEGGGNCDPSEAPTICAADDSEGVLVAHEKCNQFYVCNGGKPVALTCPPKLLFNPNTDQCDWAENVDCGDRVIPDPEDSDSGSSDIDDRPPSDDVPPKPPIDDGTCNCNPEEAPSICASEDSSGVLVAHKNCNQFYKCDHGKPVVLTCFGNLLYNPYTEQCDWPENVDCGDRVIPDPENEDSISNESGGNESGGNESNGNEGGGNCDPSEAPTICAADDSEGVLVAHENCNQFYVCNGGKPIALKCPPKLLFNPNTDQCDWAENVDCGDRVIPDPENEDSVSNESGGNESGGNESNGNEGGGNCDPSEAPTICAADDSEGVLVAHENCNQFYVCNGGKPVALKCPPKLLFNPNTDQCDWAENVDCGDRVIPDPENEDSISTESGGNESGGNESNGNEGGGNCDPSEAPTICAADDSEGVLVAHENCNQFYVCNGGKPVALKCPPKLLFNPNTDQCDWAENVDCGDRVIPDPENEDSISNESGGNESGGNESNGNEGGGNCDPSEAPTICAADDSEGVLVAHEKCNQFYVCNGGKPVALTCPPKLLFNPNTDQCDWAENVDCGDRVIPDPEDSDSGSSDIDDRPPSDDVPPKPPIDDGTCNCNPEEAPSICASEDSSGVLVAHKNCNQFYKCDHGKPVVLTCFGNLLYNPYTEQCDWPENVDCGDRVIPDPENEDSISNESGGNESGGNESNGNEGGGNCDPSEAPTICAADDSEGVLVAHENCNQFYVCNGGKPVALKCPPKLLFNPNTDQCDWAENVDCGDRVISDPENEDNVSNESGGNESGGNESNGNEGGGNCDPSEAPTICAADDSEGVLVAHENCNQFYVCNGGKPIALKCPPKLLFNPNTDQCDWAENVDCGDRVIPDPENEDSVSNESGGNESGGNESNGNEGGGNCDPSEAPTICAADDSEGVLVAHENCNQFYVCNGGKPVALKCPPKLLFNPNTDQCDWAENVDCGDRVIPDPENEDSISNESGGNESGGNESNGNEGGGNCDPSEAPTICAADDSEGVLVAHEKCNQFYVCNGGKPVALTCPPKLLFNPNTDQCDWAENVDCGDRVIPDPEDSDSGSSDIDDRPPSDDVFPKPPIDDGTCNCNPEEAPSICASEDSSGVLVAHKNCNQFYKCDHGKPVVLTCFGNLLYNPYTEQCDWPENVDCGDRVIPDPENEDSISNESGGNESGGNESGGNESNGNEGGGNCDPSEAPTICAADDSEGVLVAHENCNQFYVCNGGKPVALKCPPKLLFNPNTDQCDWAENVDCGDRVIPDPENEDSISNESGDNESGSNEPNGNEGGGNCDPSEAPTICAADDSEGVLVAHEKCNQFYVCNGGKPVALTCPPKLLFNPNTDQCDWAENVDCGDRVIPDPEQSPDPEDSDSESSDIDDNLPADDVTPRPPIEGSNESDCSDNNNSDDDTCNCDPDQAPSICAVDNSDGDLIAHENCNQFYKCDNGKAVPFKCPSNLLYNPVAQECDWSFNVECGDRVIPDPEDNVSESNEVEDDDNENGNVGPCNCNPEEAPAICALDDSSGVQIAHENCNQFYICDHGRPVSLSCNGFLLYNPYTQQCDWPANVECGDRVIPEPGEDSDDNDSDVDDDNNNDVYDDPSQAPTICAGSGSEGVLVAHENCDQYYICNGGVPVSRPCSGGLLFNPQNQRCDWPSNVKCGDRIVPDNCACNPRNAPALCAKPGSHGKLIAHENCNQFYICSHSVPVAQTCPAGLFYNIDREYCDWPQSVTCGDRILSYASLNKHWQSRQSLR